MKVIGTSKGSSWDQHYIVEISVQELARCAGHYNASPLINAVRIGSEIDVNAKFDFVTTLASQQDQVKKSAGVLRALADMIEGALPTTAIQPQSED